MVPQYRADRGRGEFTRRKVTRPRISPQYRSDVLYARINPFALQPISGPRYNGAADA